MYYLIILIFILIVYIYTINNKVCPQSSPEFIVKESQLLKNNERGLFAKRDYNEGETIEECPTLMVTNNDINYPNKINDYVFQSHIDDHVLIPFGYCGLINHSTELQNCTWEISSDNTIIKMFAVRDIKVGEELYVSYGDKYWGDRSDAEVIM
tara:strand:- start:333 stop:791 length:459 start_codon:yes stop_codon:yes gene_type:complete